MSTAYSHTPLAKKLNLKPGMATCVIDAPDGYWDWLDLPPPVPPAPPPYQWAHVFATQRAALEAYVAALRPQITPDGMIWVSWPKKAAKLPTDITEDVVREVAFAHKLVDVKVCAVNEIWSGLKLVIRRQDR
ncbi:MAG: DUF3052 domain-containing protein [Anaerolineae bacterium]|nr:DUF3052 domain-containing protein [Anaerolineae bacterium]